MQGGCSSSYTLFRILLDHSFEIITHGHSAFYARWQFQILHPSSFITHLSHSNLCTGKLSLLLPLCHCSSSFILSSPFMLSMPCKASIMPHKCSVAQAPGRVPPNKCCATQALGKVPVSP